MDNTTATVETEMDSGENRSKATSKKKKQNTEKIIWSLCATHLMNMKCRSVEFDFGKKKITIGLNKETWLEPDPDIPTGKSKPRNIVEWMFYLGQWENETVVLTGTDSNGNKVCQLIFHGLSLVMAHTKSDLVPTLTLSYTGTGLPNNTKKPFGIKGSWTSHWRLKMKSASGEETKAIPIKVRGLPDFVKKPNKRVKWRELDVLIPSRRMRNISEFFTTRDINEILLFQVKEDEDGKELQRVWSLLIPWITSWMSTEWKQEDYYKLNIRFALAELQEEHAD